MKRDQLDNNEPAFDSKMSVGQTQEKAKYTSPRLTVYGSVANLTRNGRGSGTDGGSAGMSMMSDRSAKENIVRFGEHPLGIGIYLFEYKAEHREVWGYGHQFGVMADEVEQLMPEAVAIGPDGYKRVNYAMLGISSALH